MTKSLSRPRAGGVVVAALIGLACGSDTSTPPETGTGPGGPAAPTVSAIQPTTISASASAQTITVTGKNFEMPRVVISAPDGTDQSFSGAQLSSFTQTSIDLSVVLATAGTWRVEVKNGNGLSSNALPFTVVPPAGPVIDNIVAVQTDTIGIYAVSVTGSGFQPGFRVILADIENTVFALADAEVRSPTSTSFSFEGYYPIPFDLQILVINPDGQSSPARSFHVGKTLVNPTIASLAPAPFAATSIGRVVTVNGTEFQPLVFATFTAPDGVRTVGTAAIETPTSTSARFFVALDVPGTWTLRIRNPDGGVAFASLVVTAPDPNELPEPRITGISPSTLAASDNEQTVTLNGSGFQPGLTLLFPDGVAPTPFQVAAVTPTTAQLRVTFARSGLWSVRVRNPNYVTSNWATFTIAPRPGPTVAPTVSRTSVAVTTSLAEQRFVINGADFSENLTAVVTPPEADLDVTWGSVYGRFLSTTEAEVSGVFDRSGVWRVRLVNGLFSLGTNIDIVASYPNTPTPSITGLDPAQPYTQGSAQFIKVLGTNFAPGLRLLLVDDAGARQWTPVAGQVDSVTPTSFRVKLAVPKPGRMQVQNPDGRVSNIYRYTQQSGFPSISATSNVFVSSTRQSLRLFVQAAQQGATVTLTSPAGVSETSTLMFTGTTATLDAVVNVVGIWRLRVKNPDGKESADAQFFAYAAPAAVISSLTPAAPQASHSPQPLTVVGTGFESNMTVSVVSDVSRTGQTFSGTAITNLTPASFQIAPTLFPPGLATLSITAPDRPAAEFRFRVEGTVAPPVLTTVNPSPLTKGVGRVLTVNGNNLHSPLNVTLIAPDGRESSSQAWAVNLTLSSFQMYHVFDQSGTWKIFVTSSDKQRSSDLSFVVQ